MEKYNGCFRLFYFETSSQRRNGKMRQQCWAILISSTGSRVQCCISVSKTTRSSSLRIRHGERCSQDPLWQRLRHAAVFPAFTMGTFTEICSTYLNHNFVRFVHHLSLKFNNVCADASHKSATIRRFTDAKIYGNLSVLSNHLVEFKGVVKDQCSLVLQVTLRNNVETAGRRRSGKRNARRNTELLAKVVRKKIEASSSNKFRVNCLRSISNNLMYC